MAGRPRTSAPLPAAPSGPPSVAIVGLESPATRPSGLNHYLRDLADGLRRQGVTATAVVAGTDAGDGDDFLVPARPDAPMPLRLARLWGTAWTLRRRDVLDSHFALYGLAPVLWAHARRRPVVVHFQGPWADESTVAGGSPAAARLKRMVERAVYRRADACVVLSDAFGDVLSRHYGVPRWAWARIPPGVDLGAFGPGPAEEARASLGIADGAWVAVAVRRLTPRMGLDVLLDAWAAFLRRHDGPAQLLVVGDGPQRGVLEERARRPDLAGRVRFLGRVSGDELATCYRAADVSVVPSVSHEGFGLVVLESLAAGTPVVGTDTGGLPEVLRPLADDLVVPVGDADALRERLVAAADGSLPLPDRPRCRAYAEGFSWSAISSRHIELYSAVRDGVVGDGAVGDGAVGDGAVGDAAVGDAAVQDRAVRPRLRVVVLDHTARLSGGELALARLLAALPDVDAHVILAEDGPLAGRLVAGGASVEILAMPAGARSHKKDSVTLGPGAAASAVVTAGYVAALAGRLRRLRPDVVHTNSLKSALYGGLACRLAGVPCIWHVRDRIEDDYLPGPAVSLVRRAARILPSYVVANSAMTLASLHLPAGRGEVVPSPVDIGPVADRRDADGPLRFGLLGRIAPWKGQDLFLRAFAEAFPSGQHRAAVVGAALFGEEAFADRVKALAGDLGVAERVEFRGFRADVGAELARLHVLVHTSLTPEPFGQAVVEGMAAGLPVVAAGAGGPAEVITPEVDGILYPPGDAAALAAALQRLAASAPLRRTLGTAARRTAAGYRPEVVAHTMRAVYDRFR